MKNLTAHTFDSKKCRAKWHSFAALLKCKTTLSERDDVLPFFKQNLNLSLLLGNYFPRISKPNVLAHEYGIDGHFVADLIVGDSSKKHYVLIEFENGEVDSVFKKKGKKATRDWAPRLEGAYSQLIDWLWKLEDSRSTPNFAATFGSPSATFHGLIIIGKNMSLTPQERVRLNWRMDKTMIDSKAISIISFDELKVDLDDHLRDYYAI